MSKNLVKYEANITPSSVKLWLWYRSGNLVKMELRKGRFTGSLWQNIHQVIPTDQAALEEFNERLSGKVVFTQLTGESKESPYTSFLNAWFDFYKGLNGVTPPFTAKDGKALKMIIASLTATSGTEEGALDAWKYILTNWEQLDKFTQAKTELTYIHGHLSGIITQFKNGRTGKGKARANADELRDKLRNNQSRKEKG